MIRPSPRCSACYGAWTPEHRCITGADLAALRDAAGLSQDAVAAHWHHGVSQQYVGKVENYPIPRAVTSAAYLAALEAAK